MKKTLIPVGLLGAAALFALRRLQLAKSYDNSGLISKGDKISLALYLICALAAILVLVLCLREKPGVQSPAKKDKLRGLLAILAGLALLASYRPPMWEGGAKLIVPVLAFCASCALVVEGLYHMGGATGSLLGGCILPVYLAALLISDYRGWSHDPLIADFCFPLLFLVSAMLASYHLAAFRVGRGKRRTTAFLVGCALLFAGPVLADGSWRSVLRTMAVSIYLISEFFPYLNKPDPLPEPEPAESDEPDAAPEEAADTSEAAEAVATEENQQVAEEEFTEDLPQTTGETETLPPTEEDAAEALPQAAEQVVEEVLSAPEEEAEEEPVVLTADE